MPHTVEAGVPRQQIAARTLRRDGRTAAVTDFCECRAINSVYPGPVSLQQYNLEVRTCYGPLGIATVALAGA